MILTGENRRTRRKTCHSATLSTTNPTWIDPGANPGLRGERPAINHLSHDRGSTTRIITYYTEASLHRLALSRAEVRFLTKQTFVLTRTLSLCSQVACWLQQRPLSTGLGSDAKSFVGQRRISPCFLFRSADRLATGSFEEQIMNTQGTKVIHPRDRCPNAYEQDGV
jgi:hypothetical protein